MPRRDVDFDTEVEAVEARMKALSRGIDKLETLFKKKRGEFETIHGGLWQGKEVIEEGRAALGAGAGAGAAAAGGDPDKVAKHEATFGRMTTKLGQITGALDDMGATARNLMASVAEEQDKIGGLESKLKRAGGDVSEMRAWAKALKALDRLTNKEYARAKTVKDEVDGLPPAPTI